MSVIDPYIKVPFNIDHIKNVNCLEGSGFPDEFKEIFSEQKINLAYEDITSWPGYHVTPVEDLHEIAAILNIESLHYKDESDRFGLGSFKALGGAYAVGLAIINNIRALNGRHDLKVKDLFGGRYRSYAEKLTFTCATAGNHGASVAWGAREFGSRAVIYVHKNVTEDRRERLRNLGAEVIEVSGNYDESVRIAQEEAKDKNYIVISDVAYEDYEVIPNDIMCGYTVIVEEYLKQASNLPMPSHVFVQAGVGGLAAAVCADLWIRFGKDRPRIIVVEAEDCACFLKSIKMGETITVDSDLRTRMLGLAAGKASSTAWPILLRGASDFIAISDDYITPIMQLLGSSRLHSKEINVGEAGTAGLAALLMAWQKMDILTALGIGKNSRILVIGSEGSIGFQSAAGTAKK